MELSALELSLMIALLEQDERIELAAKCTAFLVRYRDEEHFTLQPVRFVRQSDSLDVDAFIRAMEQGIGEQ